MFVLPENLSVTVVGFQSFVNIMIAKKGLIVNKTSNSFPGLGLILNIFVIVINKDKC